MTRERRQAGTISSRMGVAVNVGSGAREMSVKVEGRKQRMVKSEYGKWNALLDGEDGERNKGL